MDAREYLARQGIELDRDKERPNTLEEKAWSRAREAGDHRPRAGTPHDWEDWERHHEDLAAGAEQIDQKIDHEAHRQALDHQDEDGVAHFTPAAGDSLSVEHPVAADEASFVSRLSSGRPGPALMVLAVLLPPLSVGLAHGGVQRIVINLALTLLGWLPGVLHALWWVQRLRHD
ncbi:YqaE/Pmp3 family membrane protein [Halomonas sp.]|jgi:uncharacterized membrane protein YqaE (UPF0057 family)|uniref:YqaE/Pmp3 family membrane protein n=1 Tax=Halomonas sp. TaxID=1486246 RepID=UPI003566EB84